MHPISLVSLFLLWKAHKKLAEHQQSKHEDSADEDPLQYTSIKTLCIVPAALGIGKLVARVFGKEQTIRDWWANFARSHSFYWFFKNLYIGNLMFYFTVGFACLGLDIFKKPTFLYKYKIQPDAVIDYKVQLPRLFKTLILNIALPVILGMLPRTEKLKAMIAERLSQNIRFSPELPSIVEVTKHYWTFLLTYDILFFYAHWALHTKLLYARIHKQHHEWKSPTALAAAYAHPIEHVISNVAPAAVATLYLQPHVLTFALNTLMGLTITLSDHSGYEFIDTSAAHNIHHKTFTSNFGVSGICDKMHGTRVYLKHTHPQAPEHLASGN